MARPCVLYLPALAPVTLGRPPVLSPRSEEGVASSCLSCRVRTGQFPCSGRGPLADRALLARVSAVVWEGATVALTVAPCTGSKMRVWGDWWAGAGQPLWARRSSLVCREGAGRGPLFAGVATWLEWRKGSLPPTPARGHQAQGPLSTAPSLECRPLCGPCCVWIPVGWDGCVPWAAGWPWPQLGAAGVALLGRVWCWDSCVCLVLCGGCGRGGSENGAQGPCRVPCLPVLRCGPGDR